MNNLIDNIKLMYARGGMYLKLLYINVGVFIALNFIQVVLRLFQANSLDLVDWFSFDSSFGSILYKPWSVITYMFVHHDFWHLFSNMIVLFFIGGMFEQLLGSKKVLSTYIIGGLAGAGLYILTQNLFPLFISGGQSTLIGASAATMALFVGLAAYRPHFQVALFGVFQVQLYIIAVIYVLFDVLKLGSGDGIAHFAHLGGAIWGYYFGINMQKGKNVDNWFNLNFEKVKSIFKRKKKSKMNVSYRKTPPRDDVEYNAQKLSRQQKLDAILDKIKVGGYESLTKKEKDFLANF